MRQGLLILHARSLDNLSERVENLTSDADRFEEVCFAGRINEFLAGIMPVEIHNRFLQPQQIVDSADDYIHRCRVTGLRPEIILPIYSEQDEVRSMPLEFNRLISNLMLTEIVTLASELDEAEQGTGELGIMHVLLACRALGTDTETFGLCIPLEGIQIQHTAGIH